MKNALVIAFVSIGCTLAACGGSTPPAADPPAVTSAPAAPAADPHGFAADEYLVASAPLAEEWTQTREGRLAKMEKPADKPGDPATFFRIDTNGEQKTTFFWKSKPAVKDDLKAGAVVAYYRTDGVKGGETMPAPKDVAASRKGFWVVGHVSDVAELDKGSVKIGNQSVAIGAIRALEKPGP